MPGARATFLLTLAAELLLEVRPTEVPVCESLGDHDLWGGCCNYWRKSFSNLQRFRAKRLRPVWSVPASFTAVIGVFVDHWNLDIDGFTMHRMRHGLVHDLNLPGLRDLDELGDQLHPVLVDHLPGELHRDDLGSARHLVGNLLVDDVHLPTT